MDRTSHRSIVRVRSFARAYDYDNPWRVRDDEPVTGMAVYIGRGQLLVPAHVVADALPLDELQGRGDLARVRAVSHDSDLALLEIDDTSDLDLVDVGGMVEPGDDVQFCYFTSSDTTFVSVEEAFVTGVGVQRSSHSQRHILAASVKVGAEEYVGGVLLARGALMGLCCQRLSDKPEIVEAAPGPLLHTFLSRVRNGGSLARPALGITTQNLENPRLRDMLRLGADDGGVLVIHIDHGSPAETLLRKDDVLLEIDSMPIARDGTVECFGTLRYDVVCSLRHVGDVIDLLVLRDGERLRLRLPLATWQPLVPRSQYDQQPRFIVYGGLVFQPLTRDYLLTWEEWWNKAPKEFLDAYYLGHRTPQQLELVALTQILDTPLTKGYGHLYNELVATVNGAVPRDLSDFIAMLPPTGRVRIETTSGGVIVLDAEEVAREMPAICLAHFIFFDQIT